MGSAAETGCVAVSSPALAMAKLDNFKKDLLFSLEAFFLLVSCILSSNQTEFVNRLTANLICTNDYKFAIKDITLISIYIVSGRFEIQQ